MDRCVAFPQDQTCCGHISNGGRKGGGRKAEGREEKSGRGGRKEVEVKGVKEC